MSQRQEMLRCLLRAAGIIYRQGVKARIGRLCLGIDEHGGGGDARRALCLLGAQPCCRDNHPIYPAALEGFERGEFLFGVVVRDGEQQAEARLLGDRLDAPDDAPDERVGDGGDYETDGVGLLRLEALGDSVGRVAHLAGQLLNLRAHFDADQRAIAQRAGDGGV